MLVIVLAPTAASDAGEPLRVSDLCFTVSDPLTTPMDGSDQVLSPSGIDANGLVAVTQVIGFDPTPFLWDSTTGVVTNLLPKYAHSGQAIGVNRDGLVTGWVLFDGGGFDAAWGVTWDTTADPPVDTPLPPPPLCHPPECPYGWLPAAIADSGHVIAGGTNAWAGQISAWDPAGVPHEVDWSGLAADYDISNAGRATFYHIISIPQPFRADPPYDSWVQLPYPTEEELGFPPSTAAPLAINTRHTAASERSSGIPSHSSRRFWGTSSIPTAILSDMTSPRASSTSAASTATRRSSAFAAPSPWLGRSSSS